MVIFNSLLQKKSRLPVSKKPLRLFVCGPTVYDYSHIGHARVYVVFDAFVKWLRSRGIKITYLQNITDIDDKIIERARRSNINPLTLSRQFLQEYNRDMKTLDIDGVSRYAAASEHVKEIQKQITRLIKRGYAYTTDSGVYFEVKKFKEYGKLSKQNLKTLRANWRKEAEPGKKDALDFALWKKSRIQFSQPAKISYSNYKITNDGEPVWPSPWGWGRPGWHIEDTAITEHFFGPQYDLHGGGTDLKFPHHECEIAQQEAASGKKPLVKIWMHVGFLLVDGEKMSKSLNNFVTIRDFLKISNPQVLRLLILLHHYRTPIDYTKKLVEQTEKSLDTIYDFAAKLNFVAKKGKKNKSNSHSLAAKAARDFSRSFNHALEDDFNTAKAMASLFSFISAVQPAIWTLAPQQAKEIQSSIAAMLKPFGIKIDIPAVPKRILQIAQEREDLRLTKRFAEADKIRNTVQLSGYIIEDTPLGPFLRKQNHV